MNSNNKVYINPNFNNMAPKNNSGIHPNKLHVNPNFAHVIQNKSRIYVNPNFVHSTHQNIQTNIDNNYFTKALPQITIQGSETNTNHIIKSNLPVMQAIIPHTHTQTNISKSRYTLVRHDDAKIVSRCQENVKPKTTIKINKYKSVAISNYKKSLDTLKISQQISNKPSCSHVRDPKPIIPNKILAHSNLLHHNRMKQNSTKVFGGSNYVYRKLSTDSPRDISKSRVLKLKLIKRNLKKNNIPCPLFKKYGKCLRCIHGKCEFLHDKKHVSVCRKFIKGICHETDCLLSHDVTSKKMPTCSFYLKGMCTRDSCPYLHVKLNDQTKVCQEFLKGYCEKGENCLDRHIRVQKILKDNLNPNSSKRNSLCLAKSNNKMKSKHLYKYKNILNISHKKKDENIVKNAGNISITEGRYYKEGLTTAEEINEANEVLKPTRCKLGTLPSFIKF